MNQSVTKEGKLEPIATEKVGRGGVRPVAARWWVRDQLSLLVPTLGLLSPWSATERGSGSYRSGA